MMGVVCGIRVPGGGWGRVIRVVGVMRLGVLGWWGGGY